VVPHGDCLRRRQTRSTNFLTHIADYPTRNGTNDAFWAKITLSVTAPEIGTQPTSQTNAVGSPVTFSVGTTNGTPPFFYQWQIIVTNLVTVTNVVDGTNQVTTTN